MSLSIRVHARSLVQNEENVEEAIPAQKRAETLMLDVNADMSAHMHEHPLWERVTLQPGANTAEPQTIHVSHALGRVRGSPAGIAPQVPGGILAEEMGLGTIMYHSGAKHSILNAGFAHKSSLRSQNQNDMDCMFAEIHHFLRYIAHFSLLPIVIFCDTCRQLLLPYRKKERVNLPYFAHLRNIFQSSSFFTIR